MSGYLGNPDAESEHAWILNENAIHASRMELHGRVVTTCEMCGDTIARARVELARAIEMKCIMCVSCQSIVEQQPRARIKMLDWIL